MTTTNDSLICGCKIQYGASGVGHDWRTIDASDLPADIREEIAADILDGDNEECDGYVANNGLHYRWS